MQTTSIPKSSNEETETYRRKLRGSLLYFTQIFYYLRTGRKFELTYPDGRESHIVSICKALTRVIDGKSKKLIINVPPRYGKAISIDTPILTQDGWMSAGHVQEGDYVIGSNGWTKVIGVYPQGILEAKEVVFSDGQSIVCNDDHLWNVCDRYTPTYKTLKTSEIENTLFEADGRKHWRIPLIDGNYGGIEPFISPYLLGCWLGDGHSHYAAITTMDNDIVEAFTREGHELSLHKHQSAGKAKTYGIVKNGFSSILRTNGLLKNKHIPQDAFMWSKENRLALFQGLMDTDGTCGKNGQVSFTNVNQNIIEGIGFLVNSLGGIYRIYKRKCGTQTLNIRLPDDIKPFRLERKQRYVSSGLKCSPRRFIESILPAPAQEMVCFKVDSKDSLFAVGEGLILTHNTELVINFVSWATAIYPDSNFIYTSYSHSLAAKQTQTIKRILQMREYIDFFNVQIRGDSSAKDNFETVQGGSVYAAGAGGSITGRGAGIMGCSRFGGAIVIDDIHKPDEVTSDTMRQGIIDWYDNTLQSRTNSPDTPIIFIGQRLHDDDLAAKLISGGEFETIIIPALDVAGNVLHPTMHSKAALLKMKDEMPYVYASQYQQDPQPAGGGIFKKEWFVVLDEEPELLTTFITADTAETDKSYNDATVFSFFGLYKLNFQGFDIKDMYGLHWIDCLETRIEPKDIEEAFLDFYAGCMRHKVKPELAAIEKKSTGVTLFSVMNKIQGLRVIDIERKGYVSGKVNSKTNRYLETQPYIAQKRVSLPLYGKHTKMCIDHMSKITANETHRWDDIADTCSDGVKIGLIDKTIINKQVPGTDYSALGKNLMSGYQRVDRLKQSAYKSNPFGR